MAGGQVAKGTATGAFKGAALGANPILAGATGGLSVAIGAGVGALAGGIKAKKDQDKREQGLQLPGLEDPNQTARMLEVDRISKNIQSGTDAATERALASGAETTAATQNRLARITGGASGATVDALLKSQRAGQGAANQAVAQGQARLPFFMNLGQQISNRSEQRKLELELLQRAQTSAETAQADKERNVNFNAGIASGVLGSNVPDITSSAGRIQSLLNQGIGKMQPDVEQLPTTETTPIGGGGFDGMPELPANMSGGGAGMPGLEGVNLGSFGAF